MDIKNIDKLKTDFKIDFIGIGSAKSGSTWLCNLLEQHPDVAIPKLKEVTYFNKCSFNGDLNKKYSLGLDYYHSLWKEHKRCGEFSPIYLFDFKAPLLIKNYNSNIKLLVILRNPVDRAYSHFLYDQYFDQNIEKDLSFFDAIKKYDYLIKAGLYYNQLERYLSIFPAKNIKIFVFENAIENPTNTAKELYKFIDVNINFKPDFSAKNESKKVKFELLDWIIGLPGKFKRILSNFCIISSSRTNPFERTRLYQTLFNFKTMIKDKNIEPLLRKELSKKEYNRCFDFFVEDISQLEEKYNVDVSGWKRQ